MVLASLYHIWQSPLLLYVYVPASFLKEASYSSSLGETQPRMKRGNLSSHCTCPPTPQDWLRGGSGGTDDPSSSSKDLPRSLCLYLKWREGRKEGRKAGKGRKRSGRARTAGRERGFQSVGPRRLCARTNSPPQLGGGTSGTGNEGSTGKISNLAPSSLY